LVQKQLLIQDAILLLSRLIQKIKIAISLIRFTPFEKNGLSGIANERYRRIFLTGGSAAFVKLFSVIINLITVPLTVNYLGAERYGLWMAISSIMALMSFADLGLGNGLLNAISKANGKKNVKDAQTAVSSTFYMLFGIAGLLLIIFIAIYPFTHWEDVFNTQTELAAKEAAPTMFVLVFTFLLNMPLGIVRRIQDGYQEGFRFQMWLILGSFISFAGLLLCIYLETGLPWLVFAFSGGQLLATALNGIVLFAFQRKELFPRFSYFNLAVAKYLFQAGLVFFLLGFFTLLIIASDDIILAHTLGPSAVAGYEIVKKLFLFSMFTQYLIQPLWPAFGEALESGDYTWVRNTLKRAMKLSIISNAIISLPLLHLGKHIVNIWVGNEFIPDWSLLFGFYIYVLLNTYVGVISTFLNSSYLVKKLIYPLALTAIFSIILKIILALSIGVSGIIWATIIGYGIFFLVPSYFYSKSILNQNS